MFGQMRLSSILGHVVAMAAMAIEIGDHAPCTRKRKHVLTMQLLPFPFMNPAKPSSLQIFANAVPM